MLDCQGVHSLLLPQTIGHAPEQVTTDGHRSYPRAIREIRGQ
jgi:hypothetical protein